MTVSGAARMRLDGKVAIITGGTGGIGEATARLFLELGASVMVVGRSEEKLGETRTRLGDMGPLSTYMTDATDEAGTEGAIAATLAAFGGLDIMVANAGNEGPARPVDKLKIEAFEALMRTNVTSVLIAIKHAVPAMRARGGGSIIASGSIASLVGFPGMLAYTASKHAVYGMVKAAALELGPSNIRINAIGPGPIDNRMMTALGAGLPTEAAAAMRRDIESKVALGRYGTNEEVAHIIAFLASDASSYTTGSIYAIDGGITAA